MRKPLNLIFLPATEPDDTTFGAIPEIITGLPDVVPRRVIFPRQVWYNADVRAATIEQIRAWGVAPVILIGFSKSGLGAWNIARTIPDLVSSTIIFDAPVARTQLPPWGTQPFYADDKAWIADLPLSTVPQFAQVMPATHRLVLISGANFHAEMLLLSQALFQVGCKHVFLDRSDLNHHWNSGWIEAGLSCCHGGFHNETARGLSLVPTSQEGEYNERREHGTCD